MKYAIYNTDFGSLRAVEYADTPQGIKDYPYIKEESLPVIINVMGGYTSFIEEYENEKGFSHIIEIADNEDPLTREEMFPKNSNQFYYGWISPDGDTYACGYEGHAEAAESICKELGIKGPYHDEYNLEELGWIKITHDHHQLWNNEAREVLGKMSQLTKAAYDKICEIGLSDHWVVQGWGDHMGYTQREV